MTNPDLFESALLVEDDSNLAIALGLALKKLGIRAEHVRTLHEASQAAPNHDFLLLDRKLPDGDGLDLCEELRNKGYLGTILILTAAGMTEDRVVGLNRGADDYLPKPFSWSELDARIRALARRKSSFAATKPVWSRDDSRLRIQSPKGSWVQLTPLEFKLAAHLMESQGAIVSRDHLLKAVWGFQLLPKTRTVDLFLSRLRKYFEDDPENPTHFLTVRGAGYRFEP